MSKAQVRLATAQCFVCAQLLQALAQERHDKVAYSALTNSGTAANRSASSP